ncbi:WD40/YVTN/BNR-like repeat-containing protein [Comamonas aquatica]|uniref:WD40/YVTN/BNR-like repeat-containing protein n=1 Tax=Comamonas aquatica TaxID=225991 RepID=UPI002446A134|nr:sialidase family protein [Comamonas aquatica]MDH1815364.1 glycoside hydrolase [Comamonas aquatica]
MFSTKWRIAGLSVAGDLVLSGVALHTPAGVEVQGQAVMSASHAPISGDLSTLQTGGGMCRFAAADVQAPGFWIEWTFPVAVELQGLRFKAAEALLDLQRYSLGAMDASRWLWSDHGAVPVVTAGQWSVLPQLMPSMEVPIGTPRMVPPTQPVIYGVAASAKAEQLLLAGLSGTGSKLYRSRDLGRAWVELVGPTAGPSGFRGAASSASGQTVLAGAYGGTNARLNYSHDAGDTWSLAPALGGGIYACATDDAGDVLLGVSPSAQTLRLSVDGGATWVSSFPGLVSGGTGFAGAAVSGNGQTLLVAGYGSTSARLCISRDRGATWAAVSGPWGGMSGFEACAMSADATVMLAVQAGSSAGTVWVSRDSGVTWVAASVPLSSGGYTGAGVSRTGHLLVVTQYGGAGSLVLTSVDKGMSWSGEQGAAAGSSGFAAACAFDSGWMVSRSGTVGAWVSVLRDPSYIQPRMNCGVAELSVVPGSVSDESAGLAGARGLHSIDMEFGGGSGIYGTVEQYAQAGNIPLPRRVRLHRSRDGLLVRETWSDAQGNYRFDGISERYTYDVIAWDHEGMQQSVVANDLTPEVMS